MELLKLHPTTYIPSYNPIEGFNSLIWNERFLDPSEFELKTHNVEATRAALIPGKTLVTLRDTNAVMLVESHEITADENGARELTVKGRGFEVILDQRQFRPIDENIDDDHTPGYRFWGYNRMPAEHAALWIHDQVVRKVSYGYSRAVGPGGEVTYIPVPFYDRSANDVIPNTLASVWRANQPTMQARPDRGSLLENLLKFLPQYDLGLRTVRPSLGGAFSYAFPDGVVPAYTKTTTLNAPGLRFDVYSGVDRSRTVATPANQVIFHYATGDLEQPKILQSFENYKNVALVDNAGNMSTVTPQYVYRNGASTSLAGLDRRILFVDAGLGDKTNVTASDVTRIGRNALAEHWRTIFYEGAISNNSQYKYGESKNYYLGDTVTVFAGPDVEIKMIVSEYIRTQDESGEKGYPTLTYVDAT